MSNIILFNKPYNVISQFTDSEKRETLADYIDIKGVYPAGRLDKDSEGLMVLTDNGALQARISHPKYNKSKVYWVQVEGEAVDSQLNSLRNGVVLRDGPAIAKHVRVISEPPVWPRTPPIRERKSIPTTWLEITLTEGRNRQVRRMTAAVGLPTLRLIRYAIGDWNLGDLAPGQWRYV